MSQYYWLAAFFKAGLTAEQAKRVLATDWHFPKATREYLERTARGDAFMPKPLVDMIVRRNAYAVPKEHKSWQVGGE